MLDAQKHSRRSLFHRRMHRSWRALALSLCLAACSDGAGGGGDMGMSGGDMGMSGDMGLGGDMAGGGGSALQLLAGQLGGIGSADRTGGDARFYDALNITADGAGNIYVNEPLVHLRIRQIVAATGAVSTLAPNANPRHMVADGAGNIYFLNDPASNPAIRKLDLATGLVTTVAGGSSIGSADGMGSAAQFDSPRTLAWDGAGNLYVADTDNHTIRRIVVATGAVSTLAGTAGMAGSTDDLGIAARFNTPSGVAADADNVYVADTGNHTIRRIVVSTRAVTTLAGMAGMPGTADGTSTAARFQSPSRLASDGAGNVYVFVGSAVRKLVASTGVVTTLAGVAGMAGTTDGTGTAARFRNAAGDIAWGGNGALYVAEATAIRKVVAATGEVSTLAGRSASPGTADGIGAAARFGTMNGNPVADGAGNLYVTDTGNNRIRKIALATGEVSTLRNGAGMVVPVGAFGLAWDSAGNLYTSESFVIRKLVVATGEASIVAGALSMSGSVDGPGLAARFGLLRGLTWDGAGSLYAADANNHTIRKIVAATGEVTTIAGTAGLSGATDGMGGAARFSVPQDVVSDRNGNLYIADGGNRTIRKLAVATKEVTTIVPATGLMNGQPLALALDGAGKLYVALISGALASGTVRKVVLATGQTSVAVGVEGQMGVLPGPLPGGLNSPRGIAWVPNLGLALTEYYENVVLIAHLP